MNTRIEPDPGTAAAVPVDRERSGAAARLRALRRRTPSHRRHDRGLSHDPGRLDGTQAFSEMKRYGFGADFLHPEFKKFVLVLRSSAAGADSSGARRGEGSCEDTVARQPQ